MELITLALEKFQWQSLEISFFVKVGRGVWVFHPLLNAFHLETICISFTLTVTSIFENRTVGISKCIFCYGVEGARPEVRMQLACGGRRGVRDPDHL